MQTPRDLIREFGFRQDYIARRLGISDGYLSRLLSGKRNWTERLQEQFAMIFGIPVSEIFLAPNVT